MVNTNNYFKSLKCCCFILLQVSMVLCKTETRVVGGTLTTIDKVPYVVQLLKNGRFICGGTLVSEVFVVTAAHCVKGASPEEFTVVAGASRRTDYGIRSAVKKIMVSAAYNQITQHSDVAVMKLATPLTGASVQPIGFCKTAFKHGDPVTLVGWGKTFESAYFGSIELHTAEVNVIDNEICSDMYRNKMMITNTMFCAAANGKDSCSGDSGGPVLVNGEYCGIVSWGIGCSRYNYPGVYTNILEVLPFIQRAMQQ